MSPARTATRRPTPGTRRRTPARTANRRRPARRKGTLRRLRRNVRPATLWPPVLLILVALVGLAWDADRGEAGDQPVPAPADRCTLPSGAELTAEQVANAKIIAQVAQDRGLPDRAVVIALATAMQESRLRNIDYGDRDSLGLFQQRPSQGWGTPAQVQDPVYAAGRFYDHLVQLPGWETGDLTTVADGVQHSAYPLAYAKWSTMAEELTAALAAGTGHCG